MKYLKLFFVWVLLLHTFLYASEEVPTQEEVAKLYVATFNRAPDAGGLNYWTNNSGLRLSQIAQSFFDQPETQTLYPAGTPNRDFIKSVYNNLFNRDPDTAGWDYWEHQLNIGAFSKNRFIEAVINGAQGNDVTILNNKTTVGLYFVEAELEDTAVAKSVMEDIDATMQSVADAMQTIEDFKANTDKDNDYIPDDIEIALGMDPTNADEDGNGVVDGLQSTGRHGDTFFNKQWYIRSTGEWINPYAEYPTIPGNDLHLMEVYHRYMGYNKGTPLVVQVVDTGVDADHEDLIDNMDLSLSRDSAIGEMGDPVESDGDQGTMVAGIIGARAFNGKGVRGIAPFVKIAGSNWVRHTSQVELDEVWTRNDPEGKIVLANNNWIQYVSPYTYKEELMAYAARYLRIVDGIPRGKLFVFPAGNTRDQGGTCRDANLDYGRSNPYAITVAALKNDNMYASYSSAGSNIFVSGYGGSDDYEDKIVSTYIAGHSSSDQDEILWYYEHPEIQEEWCLIGVRISDGVCSMPTWPEDRSLSYTYYYSGTSAAAPMVSGSLALVLEACPTLSWRDVKYLIAQTAIQVDATNSSWVTNGAGFHHSVDYGFGLINTQGMIEACQSGYTPLSGIRTFTKNYEIVSDGIIPDNDPAGFISDFPVDGNKTIEWVALTITSDHTWGADLEIYLTSPSGTTTRLVKGKNGCRDYGLDRGFRYGTVAFFGEASAGTWRLKIADLEAADTGRVEHYNFTVFGH